MGKLRSLEDSIEEPIQYVEETKQNKQTTKRESWKTESKDEEMRGPVKEVQI